MNELRAASSWVMVMMMKESSRQAERECSSLSKHETETEWSRAGTSLLCFTCMRGGGRTMHFHTEIGLLKEVSFCHLPALHASHFIISYNIISICHLAIDVHSLVWNRVRIS
jgi:hypothetical protein